MKNIQVNMKVNADISAAQQQMKVLQQSLQGISETKITVPGGAIDQAAKAAKTLSQHLQAATNAQTGKLDFSALQASLKSSNTDLSTLSSNLLAMGPKGQQAFSQLSNAIAGSELSIKKTNSALASFGTTLMNTIKWQAASSMIHGAMGAFSEAVGHIKKLDRALNDIQIVSGKTSAEMAEVAKQASRISKELSSTAEESAKASLIYYQQGLAESEVWKRTETTIKMAKVTGQSVEVVSDQLTAIWNNFADGSKSLEYYADVLTKLGAATASSTDEIANGLQKFSAIAETVGMSYEYAASALATITSKTRESEEVVGTALKTIMARMQGLKLGETLDDGTTLNQYSQALAVIGVNIKDASGELRDMDDILKDTSKQWKTLARDEQVALAQSVAGVRQYNHFIAMMENWDDIEINVDLSTSSDGTLNEQMKVYKESIEASETALKQAKETLYETLFNSKMLKTFNNGLADIFNMITRIVERAGGLKSVLSFGGLVALQVILPKLSGFLGNMGQKIKDITGYTKGIKMKELADMSAKQHAIAGTQQSDQRTGFKSTLGKVATGVNLFGFTEKGRERKAETIAEAERTETHINETFSNAHNREDIATVGSRAVMSSAGEMSLDDQISAATMRTQMIKEEAGFSAEILDRRRAIEALEDGLTDKQRAQYENYQSQIQQQQELLRLTRERQLETAQAAEQSSDTGSKHVATSEAGRAAIQRGIQIAQEAEETFDIRKKATDKKYVADVTALEEEERESEIAWSEQRRKAIDEAETEEDKGRVAEEYDRSRRDMKSDFQRRRDEMASQYDQDIQDLSDTRDKQLRLGTARTADLSGTSTANAVEAAKDSATTEASQVAIDNMLNQQLTQGQNGGGPAASVENLEKLGALQAQYNADVKVATGLQSEMAEAIAQCGKDGKAVGKNTEALQASSKKVTEFASKYSKELKAALGSSSKLAQKIETLQEAGEEIDLGSLDADELKELDGAIGKVSVGLGEAGNAAGDMATAMAEDMAEMTGKDVEIFTDIASDARVAQDASIQAGQAAEDMHGKLEQEIPIQPDPFGSVVQGATHVASAITNITMGTQMLSNGISALVSSSSSGFERLSGVMMIVQGLMSSLNAIQSVANVVDTVAIAIKAAKAKATEQEGKAYEKNSKHTLKNTLETIGNAVAKVLNVEASKGLAGVVTGALAAGIILATVATVASTAAITLNTESKKKSAKQSEENAEKSKELAEKTREEFDSVTELTQAYEDALAVYEKTGQGKQELIDASFDAVNAMVIEEGELLILQGRYDELTQKIEEYNKAKSKQLSDESSTTLGASATSFVLAEQADGNNTGIDVTTRNRGAGTVKEKALVIDLGANTGDEKALTTWLDANPGSPWQLNGEKELVAYYSSNDEIGYLMKELQSMEGGVRAMAADLDISTDGSEFFKRIENMKDNGTWDQATELANLEDTDTKNQIDAIASGALLDFDDGISVSEAQTQEEYDKAYATLVEKVLEQKGLSRDRAQQLVNSNNTYEQQEGKAMLARIASLEDQIAARMMENEDTKNYAMRQAGMEELRSYNNEAVNDFDINAWAKENNIESDDAVDMFIQIQPQYLDSKEEIDKALKERQQYLDANKLIVKYDLVAGAQEANKETMTTNDWNQFYSNNANLFDPTKTDTYIGMSFEDFASQSYERRDAILKKAAGNKASALTTQRDVEQAELQDMEAKGFEAYANAEKEKIDLKYKGKESELSGDTALIKDRATYNGADETTKNQLETTVKTAGYKSVDDYFDAKNEYAKLQANDDYWKGEYDRNIESKKSSISGLNDKIFLASLEQKNQKIEDLELDEEEVQDTAEALQNMALASEDVADYLEKDADAARQASVEINRFNKSVDVISDSYEDWMTALKSKNLSEVTKATKEMSGAYADLLDMDISDFSNEFLSSTENLQLAQQAAAGDTDAYNQLQQNALANLSQAWGDYTSAVLLALQEIATVEGIDVGEKLIVGGENNELATKIQTEYENAVQAALQGGADVEQAKLYAANMINAAGYNITSFGEDMQERTVTVVGDLPAGWEPQADGTVTAGPDKTPVQGVKWTSKEGGQYTYTQTYMVPKGMTFSKKAETFGGKKSKSSGGGSKKDTADSRKKKSDIVDRYKEINDSLEETQRAMSKNTTIADGLWGPKRIEYLKQNVKLLKQETEQLEEKIRLAKQYLAEDKDALLSAAQDLGISFTFNDDGNISNYTAQMTDLYEQRERMLDGFGDTLDETEQKTLEAFDKKISKLQEAYTQYEKTLDEAKDAEEERLQKQLEAQEEYLAALNEELEVKISINDSDLELIEYFLNKISDDFYSMVEAAALMVGQTGQGLIDSNTQLGSYKTSLDAQKEHRETLKTAFGSNEINEKQYQEELIKTQSAIIGSLNSMQELDKTMQHYYGDTLAAAGEELSKYTDLMDHSATVLDHYSSLLNILGKSKDYDRIGNVLEASAKVAENRYEVSKKNYEMLNNQASSAEQAYKDAIARGASAEELEILKNNWEDAQKVANEAQDQMLSDAEAWAESLKAVLENKIAKAGEVLEDALTSSYGSFDAMTTAMERANSLQEEYLTTTNKIYETNKLMRTAQKEIDKTTNQMAKSKLKQFINETAALQEQGQLSQYELEIQQAKYDLLLAEIALKEAQNAKSTVRLQRDSEGNFGYVYTADQSAIEDAQQKFDDAQNALYNKGLEGANSYVEKYQQTMQEMYDTLGEIQQKYLDGEYASEAEYQAAMEAAKSHYYEQLQQYSSLYQVALTTDSRVVADAWSTDFADMTTQTDSWMQSVDGYVKQVVGAFEEWEKASERITGETIGKDLDDLKDKTEKITDENDNLKESIIKEGGLIDSLEKEIKAVEGITKAYAAQRQEIQLLIKDYENYLKGINDAIKDPTIDLPVSEPEQEEPSDNNNENQEPVTEPEAPSLTAGTYVEVKPGTKWYHDSAGNGPSGTARSGNIKYTSSGAYGYNIDGLGWIKKTDIVGYDTGGYTGEWGSYGKMAMLHEKELILNSHDTDNFLASMEVLHRILEIIDLQSVSSQLGGILSSPSMTTTNSNEIEQNVHIEASFPNATDHNEIEEAFKNLINTASQYANRK